MTDNNKYMNPPASIDIEELSKRVNQLTETMNQIIQSGLLASYTQQVNNRNVQMSVSAPQPQPINQPSFYSSDYEGLEMKVQNLKEENQSLKNYNQILEQNIMKYQSNAKIFQWCGNEDFIAGKYNACSLLENEHIQHEIPYRKMVARPASCVFCGKSLFNENDMYDDLFPVKKYKTGVACQKCFRQIVCSARMENLKKALERKGMKKE